MNFEVSIRDDYGRAIGNCIYGNVGVASLSTTLALIKIPKGTELEVACIRAVCDKAEVLIKQLELDIEKPCGKPDNTLTLTVDTLDTIYCSLTIDKDKVFKSNKLQIPELITIYEDIVKEIFHYFYSGHGCVVKCTSTGMCVPVTDINNIPLSAYIPRFIPKHILQAPQSGAVGISVGGKVIGSLSNTKPTKTCSCSKAKHGFASHSDWCPLYSEEQ